jgi:pimeloyl-ACP methyl ester carboxylesterase
MDRVLDHLDVERAQIVGHDWGAAIAWAMAGLMSDRVEKLVALSVGHPGAFRTAGFEQLKKSWYMLLFQFPGIAERWLRYKDWAAFRTWARHPDADAVIADREANNEGQVFEEYQGTVRRTVGGGPSLFLIGVRPSPLH